MVDPLDRPSFASDGVLRDALAASIEPLTTTDPDAGADVDDLDAIGERIGDADVIGMGEASHGTREFFRFKHRLFRYLVENHGVRLLGLEANFAATLEINEYVLRDSGTAEQALRQDGIHRPLRTESLLALIEWIRGFNEGRDPAEKIRVHGLDVQFPGVAAGKLATYFETVDPDRLATVEADVEYLVETGVPDVSDEDTLREHVEVQDAVVSTLRDALVDHESRYVDATSETAYDRATRLAWMLERSTEQLGAIADSTADSASAYRIRDAAMAAQVRWFLSHEPSERMALWAHNAHLTRGAFTGGPRLHERGIASLGRNLAEVPDLTYYALGLVLGGGRVNAAYRPEREFRSYDVEPPPDGSVPEVFDRANEPLFFLDLAGLPDDSPIAEWADSEPLRYVILGKYRTTPVNRIAVDVRRQFDGVIFVDDTSPARPLGE